MQRDVKQHYVIRVEEQIGEEWSPWFENLSIYNDGPGTLLTGPIADQAALHGLLNKIRDLGLTLIFLRRRARLLNPRHCKGKAPGEGVFGWHAIGPAETRARFAFYPRGAWLYLPIRPSPGYPIACS